MADEISAGAAGLVRIPTTSRLLRTEDFFYDCVPIAIGSVQNGRGCIDEKNFGSHLL